MAFSPRSELLRVETSPDGLVVRVAADSLEEGNVHALTEQLLALVSGVIRPHLQIDMARVRSLTGVAVSQFLALHRVVRAAGGHLVLANVSRPVHEVCRVTRLHRLLDVRPQTADDDRPRLAS